MRADEPEVPVKLRAATNPLIQKNIKLRVGSVDTSFKAIQRPKLIRKNLINGSFLNPNSEGIFGMCITIIIVLDITVEPLISDYEGTRPQYTQPRIPIHIMK